MSNRFQITDSIAIIIIIIITIIVSIGLSTFQPNANADIFAYPKN